MNDPNNPCLFCTTKNDDIIEENKFAFATLDSYPVSNQHCLIIPKRHVKEYFELSEEEILGCDQILKKVKIKIENNDKTIKGFNIGINSGKQAGQSIMHCHIHLIPRREGDAENPQGGVRAVIPSKQHYIRKNK
tara:strand:+ start:451 stop:852 length:402 start_codon:yes stop_codon:yes gene_type:complete